MGEKELPKRAEAQLVRSGPGLRPSDGGWRVINLADAVWVEAEGHGSCTELEPAEERFENEQLGFNLKVFGPGEPSTLNHREATEEGFLVLAGECLLIAEGEELTLGPWDLFICPPGVAHTLIGAGDGPCAVVMTGRRPEDAFYVADRVAASYRASPESDTPEGRQAYAEWPDHWDEVACRDGWLPELAAGPHPVTGHPDRRLPAGAPADASAAGVRPGSRGPFVVNLSRVPWHRYPDSGAHTVNAPADRAERSEELGLNVHVVWPGQPSGMYHREAGEEAFLVVSGAALLIVEGEERGLRAWDCFHCPGGTNHILVGAGDGPCVVVMVGARPDEPIVYPVDPAALRHGAGVETETPDPAVAYADRPEGDEVAYPDCLPALTYRR